MGLVKQMRLCPAYANLFGASQKGGILVGVVMLLGSMPQPRTLQCTPGEDTHLHLATHLQIILTGSGSSSLAYTGVVLLLYCVFSARYIWNPLQWAFGRGH